MVLCMEIDYEDIKYLNNVNIIDIREHYLYERGHLKGSINVPLRVLRTMPEKYLSFDKTYVRLVLIVKDYLLFLIIEVIILIV